MSFFRAEELAHGTLVLPKEKAAYIIRKLIDNDCIMIEDMNMHSLKRPFRKQYERLINVQQKLNGLRKMIDQIEGLNLICDQPPLEYPSKYFTFECIENSILALDQQFSIFQQNNKQIEDDLSQALAQKLIYSVVYKYLTGESFDFKSPQKKVNVSRQNSTNNINDMEENLLSVCAGFVENSRVDSLTVSVTRALRGNCFINVESFDPDLVNRTGELMNKCVFIAFCQGNENSYTYNKLKKICSAFDMKFMDWPKNSGDAISNYQKLSVVVAEKDKVLTAFDSYFKAEIQVLTQPVIENGNSVIEEWKLFLEKEEALLRILNRFQETDTTFRSTCWYPKRNDTTIKSSIKANSSGCVFSAFLVNDSDFNSKVPTYIQQNKFTECFQCIIDTYGVPRYKEVNPALLCIVAFPFLFGIMYGDIGHGIVLMLCSLLFILRSNYFKKSTNEMVSLVYFGRYLIFMMSICAIYCGFLYNDFFSLGLNIFGTKFKKIETTIGEPELQQKSKTPISFGIDPVWKNSSNELDLLNSYKMKLSVIFAFIHMMSGLIHKAFNCVYFKDYSSLICEFIPQVIFISCFVGYLNFLIIYKWINSRPEDNPPTIISTLINMCMLGNSPNEPQFYKNQYYTERALVYLMLVCVPIILFGKLIVHSIKQKLTKQTFNNDSDIEKNQELVNKLNQSSTEMTTTSEPQETNDSFAERFIHQFIETIEFVLGTLSNTASYLRLWALSLAHQQLSNVFLTQILLNIINTKMFENNSVGYYFSNILLAFLGTTVFALVTFAIMICMDTLECYLHVLRLQWVEFQNKFYHGDGIKFEPISLTPSS